MTAERWEIIDEEFISYTGGTAQLISNGECEIHLWERPKDAQLFCDLLNELHEQVQAQATVIKEYQNRNEILNQQIYDKNKILLTEIEINENLHDENNRIKQTIQDMMENERTELGKSVLKQLYEAIQ